MKEHLLIHLWPLALVWVIRLPFVVAQHNDDPCFLFANGTKLRHPEDCSQEIKCIDFKSVSGIKCSGAKPFYNKDTNKCETHLTDHSTCDIKCSNMTGHFVADPKSCYGYYYCQDEELALRGRCPNSLHFNQTLQSCVDVSQSACKLNKFNFCAIVSGGVKFKDQTHCGRYYECVLNKKTKILELKNEYCGIHTMYFNAARGICVAEPQGNCHPVPKDICVVKKKVKRNYFVSDGATCRGSFYCADVGHSADPNPHWAQCPGNKFFSEKKQMCLDAKDVVCLKDRCEGSTKTFVVSSERGCRHYLVCKNGVKVAEGTCGNNFFDEENGTCTQQIMTYPACYYK